MFESFSRGYYLGRLYVEPRDCDRAAMDRTQHERVNEQLYADGEGLERLDRPLVMKLDSSHFTVHGDESVPSDTLAVPEGLLEETRFRNPPTLAEVLLAKAEYAEQLLDVTGRWPSHWTGDTSTLDGGGPSGPAGI